MIPPEIVEQVRQASDIVEVIGGYVPLKRSGAKFKALSPFNKEKTPSFFVDPARQIFKCFSSGHGGDVFKFLMLMDHMTFPEAVRRLAQKSGIPIPESGPHDPQARSRREELLALNAAVATWWHKRLISDPAAAPAREYLKSRDLNSALAEEFMLGHAPDGWDATLTWARQAGYSMEALESARLVATSEGGRTFDFFRARLMIPIHDENGQVVAFSGRLLNPEAKAQKYVNSHETPVFSKSRILFGLHKTKRPIIEADSAILCEGQIDLMRCWQKGVRNVVAPQGTAFTDEQARKLKRLAKEVVICFDADNAGQNAAQRAIDVLLKEDVQVRIARIPQGEDPDSLLRKRPVAEFEAIIGEAKDYTRHLLDVACAGEDIASPRGRGAVAQKMAQTIARIPNAVQRETFLLEVSRRLGVSRDVVEEEVRKAETQQKRAPVYLQGRCRADGAGGDGRPGGDVAAGQIDRGAAGAVADPAGAGTGGRTYVESAMDRRAGRCSALTATDRRARARHLGRGGAISRSMRRGGEGLSGRAVAGAGGAGGGGHVAPGRDGPALRAVSFGHWRRGENASGAGREFRQEGGRSLGGRTVQVSGGRKQIEGSTDGGTGGVCGGAGDTAKEVSVSKGNFALGGAGSLGNNGITKAADEKGFSQMRPTVINRRYKDGVALER